MYSLIRIDSSICSGFLSKIGKNTLQPNLQHEPQIQSFIAIFFKKIIKNDGTKGVTIWVSLTI